MKNLKLKDVTIEMTNSINGFSKWLDIAEKRIHKQKICNSLEEVKKKQIMQKQYM